MEFNAHLIFGNSVHGCTDDWNLEGDVFRDFGGEVSIGGFYIGGLGSYEDIVVGEA